MGIAISNGIQEIWKDFCNKVIITGQYGKIIFVWNAGLVLKRADWNDLVRLGTHVADSCDSSFPSWAVGHMDIFASKFWNILLTPQKQT